jgi:DNA-binding transcriptional MerR regulator
MSGMSTNAEPLLTVDELAARAGVPVRTVRFYIAEGLLPGASTRGKGASYTQEHLDRLQLIRLLVARHLPLAEVRELVTRLPPAEVRDVILEEQERTEEVAAQASKPTSPKEYLSALLDQARGYPSQSIASGGAPESRGTTISPPWPQQQSPKREDQLPQPPVPPLPAHPQTDLYAPLPAAPLTRWREPALPWHRWELAPGIELQVRADVAQAEQEVIERVLDAIRAMLRQTTVDRLDNQ